MILGLDDGEFDRARKSFGAYFSRLQIPSFGRKKRLGFGAVGQDFEPALDAPGIQDTPDLDGVRWQFSGFEAGHHECGIRPSF
jgi:hypothetical protein